MTEERITYRREALTDFLPGGNGDVLVEEQALPKPDAVRVDESSNVSKRTSQGVQTFKPWHSNFVYEPNR